MFFRSLVFLSFSFFVALSVAPEPAGAQEAANKNKWRVGGEIYLWGASVEGKTGLGSDIDVDFDDIFENLEMAFMGVVGARKGKWSVFADIIYLDVGDSADVLPGLTLSGDVSSWVVTPAFGYSIFDKNRFRFDVMAGARYLYVKTDLELGALRATDSNSYWDGIVGIKGHVHLSKRWYLPYSADIGTGQTKLTWQALGGFGYRIKKWFDVNAGYRYLSFDFDSDEVLDDMAIHGPFVGLKFGF